MKKFGGRYIFGISFAITLAIALVSGETQAKTIGENIGPGEIGPVSVLLDDNAVDACWTNLKEVREYAEEKLRIQGYSLSEHSEAMENYTLSISVTAFRSKAAPTCVASIIVAVSKGSVENGIFGLHMIAVGNSVVTSKLNSNVNNRVIEQVQKVIDDM